MAASGSSSLDSGAPARYHFKLHTKLDKLDPTKRLACGPDGWRELQRHDFFRSLDWAVVDMRKHLEFKFVSEDS